MPLMVEWDPAWPSLEDWARSSVDMVPHTGQLTALAVGTNYILEFGVRSGVSTLALLMGLEAEGAMVSVDIDQGVEGTMHPAIKADPRHTLIVGDSTDPGLLLTYPYAPGIVMIDAGHFYEETLTELRIADTLDAERIVCHDYLYAKSNQPTCAVKEAVDDFLAADKTYEWETLYESMWGLAVLRRIR